MKTISNNSISENSENVNKKQKSDKMRYALPETEILSIEKIKQKYKSKVKRLILTERSDQSLLTI